MVVFFMFPSWADLGIGSVVDCGCLPLNNLGCHQFSTRHRSPAGYLAENVGLSPTFTLLYIITAYTFTVQEEAF